MVQSLLVIQYYKKWWYSILPTDNQRDQTVGSENIEYLCLAGSPSINGSVSRKSNIRISDVKTIGQWDIQYSDVHLFGVH